MKAKAGMGLPEQCLEPFCTTNYSHGGQSSDRERANERETDTHTHTHKHTHPHTHYTQRKRERERETERQRVERLEKRKEVIHRVMQK